MKQSGDPIRRSRIEIVVTHFDRQCVSVTLTGKMHCCFGNGLSPALPLTSCYSSCKGNAKGTSNELSKVVLTGRKL